MDGEFQEFLVGRNLGCLLEKKPVFTERYCYITEQYFSELRQGEDPYLLWKKYCKPSIIAFKKALKEEKEYLLDKLGIFYPYLIHKYKLVSDDANECYNCIEFVEKI